MLNHPAHVRIRIVFLLSFVSATMLLGCLADDGMQLPPPRQNTIPTDTATTPLPNNPVPTNRLRFEKSTGDDGAPCDTLCAYNATSGTDIELSVIYEEPSGLPIADAIIRFELANDAPGGVQLASETGYTNSMGRTSVMLQSNQNGHSTTGNLLVTASTSLC